MRRPKTWSLLLLSVTAVSLTGCFAVNSYVEPGHAMVNPNDITPRANPEPVALKAIFLRNGDRDTRYEAQLRRLISDELSSTGVLKVVPADRAQATLSFTVDNRYNHDKAFNRGFFTGMTLGASGKTVIDRYHFTISLLGEHQPLRRGVYDTDVQTTVGNASAPVSAHAVSSKRAYVIVVQQAVQNFLFDLQSAGNGPLPIGFIHE